MANKKATSAAPAAARKSVRGTTNVTKTTQAKAKRAPAKKTVPVKDVAPHAVSPAATAPASVGADVQTYTPIQLMLAPGTLERGLTREAAEYEEALLDPREVDQLIEHPAYKTALASNAAKRSGEDAPSPKVLRGLHSLRMFRAGVMATYPDSDEVSADYAHPMGTFYDLESVSARPTVIDEDSGGIIRAVVMAFCSYENRPFGKYPDVYPMPHQSNRAGNKLMFQVGTDELTQPTASGWAFKENDWLEIDPNCTLSYTHGDLVVAVHKEDLTLLELRSKDGEEDGSTNLIAAELHEGTTIAEDLFLIIGRVRGFGRSYFGPETAGSRAVDEMIASRIAFAKSRKGGRL